MALSVGCAQFGTIQIDERSNEKTGENTKITTKASSRTFFSSKSELTKWKATQTEKSQGAEVGGLSQQGATNAVGALKAVAEILKALPK